MRLIKTKSTQYEVQYQVFNAHEICLETLTSRNSQLNVKGTEYVKLTGDLPIRPGYPLGPCIPGSPKSPGDPGSPGIPGAPLEDA